MSDDRRSQLERLAKPFGRKFVHTAPSGHGEYVSHDVINQALLAVCGPFSWSCGGWVLGPDGFVEGCTGTLRLVIDGVFVEITAAGECDNVAQKKTQGERMKNAESDAFKRCAMRVGCGLHLWAQDEYVLYGQLSERPDESDVI